MESESISPNNTIGNTSPASSDRGSLTTSPTSPCPQQLKRVATKDDSSDEGTLGHSASQSSLANSGLVSRRTSKAVFHERSGLWILPLSEVDTTAATTMYLNLQTNGLLFNRMNLQDEELRQYAEFHIRCGQAEPWNMCAMDENGKVAGLCIFLRSAEAIEASHLNPLALDHWRIFIELERTFARRSGIDTSDHMVCTFLGMMPEHQSKGLMGEMQQMMSDLAFEHGFRKFWSWTLNPNVLKAMGRGDGAISWATRLSKLLFTVPPWVSNEIIVRFFSVTGLIPKGLCAFWVPLPSLGIESVEKAGAGLNPCVSANVLSTTAVKNQRRLMRKTTAGTASKRVMIFMALFAVLVAVQAARSFF